jgi:hypothetical protein
MKNKILSVSLVLSICFMTHIKADPVSGNPIGVGARAFSLANNYVALGNDLSGVFWNPGALSFLQVREFQASFDALDNRNETDFSGTKQDSDLRRLRMSNIGCLISAPVTKGGFSLAATIQTPYVFDDNPSFQGSFVNTKNQNISVQQDYKAYGGLTYLSGAFGIQVAPGLGFGGAISIISGSEKIHQIFSEKTNGDWVNVYNDDYDRTTARSYLGYDARIGVLYPPASILRFGMRFTLPQQLWFTDDFSENYPGTTTSSYSSNATGQLLSSYSGAMGVAVKLPFLTASSEVRARAPYDLVYPDEQIPKSSPASHAKFGAGIGLEAPVPMSKLAVRCGYSWDQYDPFLFVSKYDEETTDWTTGGLTAKNDRNLFTAGLAYVENSWCIEGAFGHQTWKLDTKGTLTEDHILNRVTLSLSLHF